jgi:prefoldin subunit 5
MTPTYDELCNSVSTLYHQISRLRDEVATLHRAIKVLQAENEEVARVHRILDSIDLEAPPFVDPEYLRKPR